MTLVPIQPGQVIGNDQATALIQSMGGIPNPNFGGALGGLRQAGVGLGNVMQRVGGALFPGAPGVDPAAQTQAQQQAMLMLGLGLMSGRNRPGATFGGSLFDAFRGASQTYQGAMDSAFKNTLLKRQTDREDKAEERQQETAERTQRQSQAITASRIAAGLSSSSDPVAYWNLVRGMPEVQEALKANGIDAATLTTPEALQAAASQLGSAGQIGMPATTKGLELKAIAGPDGKPIFVPESMAAFKTPYYKDASGKDPAQVNFERANVLRDEYTAQVKDFGVIQSQYGNIRATAKQPSAAGDIALLTSYMKMLDPSSTVREGEFATAQNAGGVNEIVRAKYNQLLRGERLTTEQRGDFLKRAGDIFGERKALADKTRRTYRDLAKRAEVDPLDVIGAEEVERPYIAVGPNNEQVIWNAQAGQWQPYTGAQ